MRMSVSERIYRKLRKTLGLGCGIRRDLIVSPSGEVKIEYCDFCNEMEVTVRDHTIYGGCDRADDILTVAAEWCYNQRLQVAGDELLRLRSHFG